MKPFKFFRKNIIHVRYIGGQTPRCERLAKLSLYSVYTVKYECNMLNNDGSVGEPCYYLEEMMDITAPDGRPYAFASRMFEIFDYETI